MSSNAMQPEENAWFRSWSLMGTRAWSLLESSETVDPALVRADGCRHGLPWMRFWDDALGFGREIEPYAVTVLHPVEPGEPAIVRKAIWQRTSDLSRLHNIVERQHRPVSFEPTIAVEDARVPVKGLEEVLRSGFDLRVPLVGMRDSMSCTTDVGSVGFDLFTLDQPQARISLEWSYDYPPEWQPAIEFIERLRAFLERHFQ